jgi:hypothetical protein
MHYFHKFILSRNSTCFGQSARPSSGVYSLYTQQWYMSCRQLSSRTRMELRTLTCPSSGGQIVLSQHLVSSLSVNSCTVCWMRADCRAEIVKLVHLVGFITKKFVMMHGHMNVKLEYIVVCRHRMSNGALILR